MESERHGSFLFFFILACIVCEISEKILIIAGLNLSGSLYIGENMRDFKDDVPCRDIQICNLTKRQRIINDIREI